MKNTAFKTTIALALLFTAFTFAADIVSVDAASAVTSTTADTAKSTGIYNQIIERLSIRIRSEADAQNGEPRHNDQLPRCPNASHAGRKGCCNVTHIIHERGNHERKSSILRSVPERNGHAQHRRIHRMGTYHSTVHCNRLASQ